MTASNFELFSVPASAAHAVQFYEDDATLRRAVSGYLRDGVRSGERLMVIATSEHRESFTSDLRADGVDPADAIFLDARSTLEQFFDGKMIDESRFHAVVGGAVASAGANGRRVRAYGEIVELLWGDGNSDAALRLEELWNDLAMSDTFSLLCAYSTGHFYKTTDDTARFDEVCNRHDHVIHARRPAASLENEIRDRRELESSLREALAARRAAELDLRDFLENATVGIHRVGPDGTILWANQAELDLLGYAEADYVGRNITEVHADREVIEDILQRLTSGEQLRDREARLLAKDGSIRHVAIDSNVRFDDGRFLHTRCFTRDITARKHAEEANAKLYESARDANRAKDEFLATLSHELRTPLTAILGWARLLMIGDLDEATTQAAIQTIERSARTQASLIDDLLDLSRVVTGKLTLANDLVDLGAVIEAAVETQRLAASSKAIGLALNMPNDRVVVHGDATRLQQVIWNLVANAIKFSDEGAEVSVTLHRIDDTASITVRDTGRGIGAEFLPHVFEPFRQADAKSTRAFGGLGLGLAIVKYLAEAHGGSVAALSDGLGRGAAFEVRLPVALSSRA